MTDSAGRKKISPPSVRLREKKKETYREFHRQQI